MYKSVAIMFFVFNLLFAFSNAQAQNYPNRPIRLIVPFGPGGATDIVARVVGAKLSVILGQPVIIENRSGAGGIVGTTLVKGSAPDGYTLLMATIGFGANPALFKEKLPFNPVKDFTHITQLVNVPTVLVVHPSIPARSTKELLDFAAAKPGHLNFGSAGFGTINHLAGEMVKSMTGLKLVHIPYKSGGASVGAVASGEISMIFATTPTVIGFIKDGMLIPLAASGSSSLVLLPNVPLMGASIPNFSVVEWQGIVGPAGMDAGVVAKLHKAIIDVLKDPDVSKRLVELGTEIVGSEPKQFEQFVKNEVIKWNKVAEQTGMKAED